jgi:hypothetical protein
MSRTFHYYLRGYDHNGDVIIPDFRIVLDTRPPEKVDKPSLLNFSAFELTDKEREDFFDKRDQIAKLQLRLYDGFGGRLAEWWFVQTHCSMITTLYTSSEVSGIQGVYSYGSIKYTNHSKFPVPGGSPVPQRFRQVVKMYDANDVRILPEYVVKYPVMPRPQGPEWTWSDSPGELAFTIPDLNDDWRTELLAKRKDVTQLIHQIFHWDGTLLEQRWYQNIECQRENFHRMNGKCDAAFLYSFKRAKFLNNRIQHTPVPCETPKSESTPDHEMPINFKRRVQAFDKDGKMIFGTTLVKYLYFPTDDSSDGENWVERPGEIDFLIKGLPHETHAEYVSNRNRITEIFYTLLNGKSEVLSERHYQGMRSLKSVSLQHYDRDDMEVKFTFSFQRSKYTGRESYAAKMTVPPPKVSDSEPQTSTDDRRYRFFLRTTDANGVVMKDVLFKVQGVPKPQLSADQLDKWIDEDGQLDVTIYNFPPVMRSHIQSSVQRCIQAQVICYDAAGTLLKEWKFRGVDPRTTDGHSKDGEDEIHVTLRYKWVMQTDHVKSDSLVLCNSTPNANGNFFKPLTGTIARKTSDMGIGVLGNTPFKMPKPEYRYFFQVFNANNTPITISLLAHPGESPARKTRPSKEWTNAPGVLNFNVPDILKKERDKMLNTPIQSMRLCLTIHNFIGGKIEEWQYDGATLRELSNENIGNEYVSNAQMACEYKRIRHVNYLGNPSAHQTIPISFAVERPKPTDNPWNGIIGLATLGSAAAALWWLLKGGL